MEKSIFEKVNEVAVNRLNGKYNLVQYKAQKAKAVAHKTACEGAIQFYKENPLMPFYAVLSVGISAGAFKSTEFAKGYKKFDAEKAKACLMMANAYNKKMGIKGKPSDVVWRLVTRYYNKKSHNVTDFEKTLESVSIKDGKRGHFAELCENLGI